MAVHAPFHAESERPARVARQTLYTARTMSADADTGSNRPADTDTATIDAFLDTLWMERGLSANTLSAYGTDLRGLAGWLAGRSRTLHDARRQDLQAYVADRIAGGMRWRSIRRILSTIKRFYRFQVRSGRMAEDPSARIDTPRLGRPRFTLGERGQCVVVGAGYRDRPGAARSCDA